MLFLSVYMHTFCTHGLFICRVTNIKSVRPCTYLLLNFFICLKNKSTSKYSEYSNSKCLESALFQLYSIKSENTRHRVIPQILYICSSKRLVGKPNLSENEKLRSIVQRKVTSLKVEIALFSDSLVRYLVGSVTLMLSRTTLELSRAENYRHTGLSSIERSFKLTLSNRLVYHSCANE